MEGVLSPESAVFNHPNSSPINTMYANDGSPLGHDFPVRGSSTGESLPITPKAWEGSNETDRAKNYLTVTPQNEATGPRMEEIEDLFSLVCGRMFY